MIFFDIVFPVFKVNPSWGGGLKYTFMFKFLHETQL